MLSYRHAFHAGNHADILKHATLVLLLESLQKKEKPFTMYDTHSGAGRYKLDDERALLTGEVHYGIKKFLASSEAIPECLASYKTLVKNYAKHSEYPGSPEIEKSFLRTQDFLVLMELHNTEIKNLEENMKSTDKNLHIAIHHKDGFKTLEEVTPPKTKRGLALIDPSYEIDQDYQRVISTVCKVHQRWTNGIIALWYPLLHNRAFEIEDMKNRIIDFAKNRKNSTNPEILTAELVVDSPHKERGLYGSGMLVINPCWKLQENLEEIIEYYEKLLQVSENSLGNSKVSFY
ncbi:MAG: 23S rRNA (adenine(2030)-N(6))-methyltransferase RlmJ [Spirochaetaceae bacterium]|nr:23S rRNA (adenine(2030)-N(6))-methyltransferase RlmJ [Spirochaetaceae bacterium]